MVFFATLVMTVSQVDTTMDGILDVSFHNGAADAVNAALTAPAAGRVAPLPPVIELVPAEHRTMSCRACSTTPVPDAHGTSADNMLCKMWSRASA